MMWMTQFLSSNCLIFFKLQISEKSWVSVLWHFNFININVWRTFINYNCINWGKRQVVWVLTTFSDILEFYCTYLYNLDRTLIDSWSMNPDSCSNDAAPCRLHSFLHFKYPGKPWSRPLWMFNDTKSNPQDFFFFGFTSADEISFSNRCSVT